MNTSRFIWRAIVVIMVIIFGYGCLQARKPLNTCNNKVYFVSTSQSGFTVKTEEKFELATGFYDGNISIPRTIIVDIPEGLTVNKKDQPECLSGRGCQITVTTGYDSSKPLLCTYLEYHIGTLYTDQPGIYTIHVAFLHQDPDNKFATILDDRFPASFSIIN